MEPNTKLLMDVLDQINQSVPTTNNLIIDSIPIHLSSYYDQHHGNLIKQRRCNQRLKGPQSKDRWN